jgi:hypothetical protein
MKAKPTKQHQQSAMNHNTTIFDVASYHQPLQHYFNMATQMSVTCEVMKSQE